MIECSELFPFKKKEGSIFNNRLWYSHPWGTRAYIRHEPGTKWVVCNDWLRVHCQTVLSDWPHQDPLKMRPAADYLPRTHLWPLTGKGTLTTFRETGFSHGSHTGCSQQRRLDEWHCKSKWVLTNATQVVKNFTQHRKVYRTLKLKRHFIETYWMAARWKIIFHERKRL